MADGYQAQITPGGTAVGAVQADGGAFGAGIGEGISDIATSVKRLRDDQDLSAFSSGFAKLRSDNDQAVRQLQDSAPAGGDGHHDRVVAMLDDQKDNLLQTIRDPRLRRQANEQWDSYASRESSAAYQWQAGAAAGKAVSDAKQAGDTAANRVLTGSDGAYAEETGHWHDYIHSLQGIDGNQRDQLLRYGDEKLAIGQISRLRNTSPTAAIAAIDRGAFNDVLSPEQIQQARRGAEVDLSTKISQEKAQKAQADALERKSISAATAELQTGRARPDQWYALASRSEAVGDQADAVRARAQGDEIAASEAHRGDTPQERQAVIAELSAKPELSAEEGARLKGLQGQQRYVDGLPPVQRMAYATGNSVAPLDWQDPDSIKARALQVSAAQQRFGGKPDFLLPGEEQPIKQLIASADPADKVAAARSVLQAGPYAKAVLDQVAPNDRDFRAATRLAALPDGDRLMSLALSGPDAIKANQGLLTRPKDDFGKPVGPMPGQVIDGELSAATALLDQGTRADIAANARNIYLATAARSGWTDFHPAGLAWAARTAVGGSHSGAGWTGVGQWQGSTVITPQGWSQGDLERSLSRADGQKWIGAAANPNDPPWTGDRPLHAGELRSLVPVVMADGNYALRSGPNSYITTKSGKRFEFDLEKLR